MSTLQALALAWLIAGASLLHPQPMCADCNLDGQLSILDALEGARHSASLLVLVGEAFRQCDVDADGDVDVLDALVVAQEAVGLPVALACAPAGLPPVTVEFTELLSTNGSTRATAYWMSNKIVRSGQQSFVCWLDQSAEARIGTYDHVAGAWGPVTSLGYGTDNHGGPALTGASPRHAHDLVVDGSGSPWMLVSHLESGTTLLWHHDGASWSSIDLLPHLQVSQPGRLMLGGCLTFDDQGALYIVAETIAPGYATWFGDPSQEVVLLTSDDQGATFDFQALSIPDAGTSNWLTSIERPHGPDTIGVPALLYTHGAKTEPPVGQPRPEIHFVQLQR